MRRGNRLMLAALAAIAVLSMASEACAWGPATHVKLASDVLSNLWMIPAGVSALIARNRRAFLYGSVATDTVFAKKMSRVKQICHHWSTGFAILDSAKTDEGRAFGYGYLSHLAADTIAHNKFLPRQMAVSRSTVTFGHVYWEIRADSGIEAPHWTRLRAVLRGEYVEPPELLRQRLVDTLLSFETNRVLFRRMNMLASERSWRRSVDFWSRLSRHTLEMPLLTAFHDESMDRIIDVLNRGPASAVLHEDPNGNAALAHAKVQRKLLRQLGRARLPRQHVIDEAAASHAPNSNRSFRLTDAPENS